MKFVIVAFIFTVFGYASADWKVQTQEDLVKYRGECVSSLGVPSDYVEKFKKWEFPDDQTTKCYIKCIFGKLGLFNAEKGFNVEHLVEQLGQNRNKDEIRTEINKCIDKNEQKTDDCAWVYRGFKCFLSKNLPLVQQSIKNN